MFFKSSFLLARNKKVIFLTAKEPLTFQLATATRLSPTELNAGYFETYASHIESYGGKFFL